LVICNQTNDYDRIPRLETFKSLRAIQERLRLLESEEFVDWSAFSVEEKEKLRTFMNTIRTVDYVSLADECSLESVYPDETDLRLAASEIQNPVGCY
jgi:hypothetical protein